MNGLLAYLDPGTGSLVLQVIVGGFAGFFVFLRWLRDWIRKPAGDPTISSEETRSAAAVGSDPSLSAPPQTRPT